MSQKNINPLSLNNSFVWVVVLLPIAYYLFFTDKESETSPTSV